jgi:putative OPT family oligopeptide transporter
MGAGAVGAAGLFTVLRTAPTMARALAAVFRGLRSTRTAASTERTDRDLPAWTIVVGVVGIALTLALVPWIFAGEMPLSGRIVASLGAVVFSLVFVPVASRLVGVIGQSSNPISAMALITLASTAGIFLALGWKGPTAMAAVLTVGAVVCVAASKAGDISQDLKTGWLVGGTPALQQFGQLIAAAVGCWVIAAVVCAIGNSPDGFGDGAPQARLMKTVIEAVLGDSLPWDLVLSGGALAGVGILAGLPALPFALGIYLPLSTMATVFVGGCVRRLLERASSRNNEGAKTNDLGAGILCASGYVAGEGLAGVLIAGWAYYSNAGRQTLPPATTVELFSALALLIAAAYVLYRAGSTRTSSPS